MRSFTIEYRVTRQEHQTPEIRSFSSSGYNSKSHYKLRISVLKMYFDDIDELLKRVNTVVTDFEVEGVDKDILFKAVDWANKENENPEKYNDRYDEDYDD